MALFASHRQGPAQNNHLIEIKAGKCQATSVPGDSEKMNIKALEGAGLIYLSRSDDGLMRFCYKNRDTNSLTDELIVFQSDAIFVPVDEDPDARVYLFKFKNSSTDRWLFFWMQDADASKDEERCKRMNDLLSGDASSAPAATSGTGGGRQSSMRANNAANILSALGRGGGAGGTNAQELMELLQQSGVTREQLQRMLQSAGEGRLAGILPPELLDAAGYTPRSTAASTRAPPAVSATPQAVQGGGAAATLTTPANQAATAATPAAPQRARQPGGNRVAADDLRNILNRVVAGGTPANSNVAALAEGLQSAAIGEGGGATASEESDKKDDTDKKPQEEQEPSAKRNKPDKGDDDDKDGAAGGGSAAAADGMDLD